MFGDEYDPLDDPEVSFQQDLDAIEKFDFIDFSERTFPRLIANLEKSINQSHEKKEPETHLLIFTGPPGVGKTRYRTLITDHLRLKYNTDTIQTVTWERDGEAVSRSEGLITSKPEELLTDTEIPIVNARLKQSLVKAIQNSNLVIAEVPATATKAGPPRITNHEREEATMKGIELQSGDDIWLGRDLGTSALEEIAKSALYPELRKNLGIGPIKVFGVSLERGPLLKFLMMPYRGDMKKAKSLQEAQVIAHMYGQPIPISEGDWEAIAVDGANEMQTDAIDDQIDAVLTSLVQDPEQKKRGSNIQIPSYKDFEKLYYERALLIANLVPQSMEQILQEMYKSMKFAFFYQHTFRFAIPIPKQRIFNGFNNPDVTIRSKIPNIALLKYYLQEREDFSYL